MTSFLGGIVLIVSPFKSVAVPTTLAGCWLLALGITEIITAFRLHGRAKHALPTS
ncbi:DUF308 domain-containing protein [Streptomyces syringium]|uniref:DUF308 domain-containing protein n=1 Tax=Streptomyces syringium TaxID=76729 RepID=UPI003D8EC877